MPRRRPGQLRKLSMRLSSIDQPPEKIPYLSWSAAFQLALADVAIGWPPGTTAEMLRAWRRITLEVGNPFYLPLASCTCGFCDLASGRRDLFDHLVSLTRRERALLRVPLGRLDRWFAARTLPDPLCTGRYWFERRLRDQDGWGRIRLGELDQSEGSSVRR